MDSNKKHSRKHTRKHKHSHHHHTKKQEFHCATTTCKNIRVWPFDYCSKCAGIAYAGSIIQIGDVVECRKHYYIVIGKHQSKRSILKKYLKIINSKNNITFKVSEHDVRGPMKQEPY